MILRTTNVYVEPESSRGTAPNKEHEKGFIGNGSVVESKGRREGGVGDRTDANP